MRLLGLDLETTGLSTTNDYVTEIGWVLIDTEIKKPLITFASILKVPEEVVITPFITELTHITREIINEFGVAPEKVYARLEKTIKRYKVDYIVAHNGNGFDKPMLKANMDKVDVPFFDDVKWIDTMRDIEYPKHMKSKALNHLCGDHGFINPFPHAALFDVMAMMKLVENYDIEEIVNLQNSPCIVVEAVVDYANKDKAKKKGFNWGKANYNSYPKKWVREIKESQLAALKNECDFPIRVINN